MGDGKEIRMYQKGTCRAYLFELAETAARLAGRNPEEREKAETAARRVLETAEPGLLSPILANRMLEEITRITGNSDPYSGFKADEMAGARKAFEEIRDDIGDDLRSAVTVAAMGNSLDFFRSAEDAFGDMTQALKKFQFFHDDIELLEVHIERGVGLVLYLTDNAGEIFFDQVLYQYLAKRAERAVLVVKGQPAMNDLTRQDLPNSGVAHEFTEVADTGGGAGVEWDRASAEFLALVSEADLVLAKGLANFLTVYQYPLPCPAFFLFKAKCQPVRTVLDSPADTFWALWQGRTV